MNRLAITAFLVSAILLGGALHAGTGTQEEDGVQVQVLNAARIYHPTPFDKTKKYSKIGLVDSKAVFDETPEYKEIKRRKLDKNSAEYMILAKKASDRFKKAIQTTVSLGGYDLIAETGAVTVKGQTLSDISQELIQNLN